MTMEYSNSRGYGAKICRIHDVECKNYYVYNFINTVFRKEY